MESFKKLALILILLFATVGTRAQDLRGLDKAQKLPASKFKVCGESMKLELANEPQERAIGLMNRSGVEKGTGMVFVFARPEVLDFWMKNVPFDIDIGYFDSKGHLIKAMTMAGTSPLMNEDALPRYSSDKEALFAVETAPGFFAKHSVKSCRLSPLPKRPKS